MMSPLFYLDGIWLTALTTVVINIYSVDCVPTTQMSDNIQACGKDLADLLQRMCKNGYNSYPKDHDSIRHRRRKRGVTTECCYQPCTRGNLLAYCNPESQRATSLAAADGSRKISTDETDDNDNHNLSSLTTINNSNNNNNNNIDINKKPENSASSECNNRTLANNGVNNRKNNEIRTKTNNNEKPCIDSGRMDVDNEILKKIPNFSKPNNASSHHKIYENTKTNHTKDGSWQVKIKNNVYYYKQALSIQLRNNYGNTTKN